MARLLPAAFMAAACSACAFAESDQPLFGEAQQSTLAIEPGLWAAATEQPCTLPITPERTGWPACAAPFVLTADTLRSLDPQAEAAATWLIVRGEPPIVQFTRPDGGAQYWALALDGRADGPVRTLRLAPLLCPDPETPVAGVRRVEDGCRADTAAALRAIAATTRPEQGLPAVWVAPSE